MNLPSRSRSLALVALTFAFAQLGSARTLQILEYTSELRLADVELPITASGTVTFRLCETCESYSLSVTPETEYLGFDGPLSLQDFRALVTQIRLTPAGNYTTGVGVTYGAESQLVTRISLHRNALTSGAAN